MISDIHNEIDHTDAITMDDVYDSCNSIKKLIETLNYSLSEFAPSLQLYFMIVAFDELFPSSLAQQPQTQGPPQPPQQNAAPQPRFGFEDVQRRALRDRRCSLRADRALTGGARQARL